jgi:hypothetical protein
MSGLLRGTIPQKAGGLFQPVLEREARKDFEIAVGGEEDEIHLAGERRQHHVDLGEDAPRPLHVMIDVAIVPRRVWIELPDLETGQETGERSPVGRRITDLASADLELAEGWSTGTNHRASLPEPLDAFADGRSRPDRCAQVIGIQEEAQHSREPHLAADDLLGSSVGLGQRGLYAIEILGRDAGGQLIDLP